MKRRQYPIEVLRYADEEETLFWWL